MNRIIANIYNIPAIKGEFFSQATKYFIVGGFCTVIDLSMLLIFTHFLIINYLTSFIISFMSGAIINYYLCTLWIFKIWVIEKHYQELIYYSIITGVGLGINTLIIWGVTEFTGLYFMFSKLFAIVATYWWNFGAQKYFLHTIK
ncbi:MAG: GtrA family protein [Candidatus Marinimicrobia bacterium]|nr:GtrA family protein [Candidatus Neomarinimicrobiota bacterium]